MKNENKPCLGIVLLAAGEASRMGMPKQLLVHERVPLIRHLVTLLLELELPVGVVLGARASLIAPVIDDLPVQLVVNEDWASGMGGSLRCGLELFTDREGVLFCVVDQPYLSKKLLRTFINQFQVNEDKAGILLAAKYESRKIGVPALFGKNWYGALQQLNAEFGARKLIRSKMEDVETIDFPKGDFDLDRPEDWDAFRQR